MSDIQLVPEDQFVPDVTPAAAVAYWVNDEGESATSALKPEGSETWRLVSQAEVEAAAERLKAMVADQLEAEAAVKIVVDQTVENVCASAGAKLTKLGFTQDEQDILLKGFIGRLVAVEPPRTG